MSTELNKYPTTTEIPIQRKDPITTLAEEIDPLFNRTTLMADPIFDRTLVDPMLDRTLVDPVFDRTLVDPFFDRTLGAVDALDFFDPVTTVNEMMRRVDPMLRPTGWTDLVNRPLQTMEKQLGPLTNIIKADIIESRHAYKLHAGTQYMQHK
jgi:hypothetical protein